MQCELQILHGPLLDAAWSRRPHASGTTAKHRLRPRPRLLEFVLPLSATSTCLQMLLSPGPRAANLVGTVEGVAVVANLSRPLVDDTAVGIEVVDLNIEDVRLVN